MSAIAIIPARGGSKRIPKKNIKIFCGKPIICYSISAALESGIFDEVMVSTDSKEIAEISEKAGAKVPFIRSKKNSDDDSTVIDVVKEVLDYYDSEGKRFDILCTIYPTAPFVTPEKLKMGLDVMEKTGADGQMTVVQYGFPPQRSNVIKNGLLEYCYPEYRLTRSQDLEPIYHDTGQFYFGRIAEDLSFETHIYAPLIVPETEAQDIDNETDWKIAEMKYSLMLGKA